ARDKDSYKMLLSLTNNKNEKIKLYPDITIKIKTDEIKIDGFSNYTCIVPNERMLDQGREFWPEGKYLSYIHNTINLILKETDHIIIILIHDKGMDDTNLAYNLKSNYPENERIIVHFEEDTIKLKSILGGANMVIGSRYHALVSALSQNIPSLALGWSHKYKMLFDEYKIGDFSFDKPNDELFDSNMRNLLDNRYRNELIDKISESNKVLKEKNKQMWSDVIDILNT